MTQPKPTTLSSSPAGHPQDWSPPRPAGEDGLEWPSKTAYKDFSAKIEEILFLLVEGAKDRAEIKKMLRRSR